MPAVLALIQVLFVLFCKFTSKKRLFYAIPVICLSVFFLAYPFSGMNSVLLFLSYLIMIDLAISDILYREIDPKSYIPLLLFSFAYCFIYGNLKSSLLSLAATFLLMLIYYKLGSWFGEDIGGADVKLMLILSFFYGFSDIFMFLVTSIALTVLLSVFYSIKNRSVKVSTPMIVSIAAGHIFISLIYLLGFRINIM